jgi:hypothetical protein
MKIEVVEVNNSSRYMIDYDGGSSWEATFDAAVTRAKSETEGDMKEAVIYKRIAAVNSLGVVRVTDDDEGPSDG